MEKQRQVRAADDKCLKWKKSFVCESGRLKWVYFDRPLQDAAISRRFLTPETANIYGSYTVLLYYCENFSESQSEMGCKR